MAIVTYNDNGTIKVVKFGTYVVSTDADPVVQKQWVYLYDSTSDPSYTPFYQIITMEEQATVELMEQKFPARNYNIGQFGAIQWWENFYVFQVQEV